MTFKEYQKETLQFFRKNKNDINLVLARLSLGLSGEAGEVAEKMKKYLRDTDLSQKTRNKLKEEFSKELGDVMWYLAMLANKLNLNLAEIAKENIDKLASRKRRNKLKGSGDNR